jgi:diadenosine tetraphosphate (Ap4A) HIT family hydrolase
MRDPNNPCLFCNSKESEIAYESDLAYASYDSYPVSKHHCLIIPKRHVVDYFELLDNEVIACNNLIKIIKKEVMDVDKSVKAFNIGTNAGKLAGQSIMHCHIHLIPRREGDVDNPQGGVRSVVPKKQHYERKI